MWRYSVLRKPDMLLIKDNKLKLYSIAGIYSSAGYTAEHCYIDQFIFVKPPYRQTFCYRPFAIHCHVLALFASIQLALPPKITHIWMCVLSVNSSTSIFFTSIFMWWLTLFSPKSMRQTPRNCQKRRLTYESCVVGFNK